MRLKFRWLSQLFFGTCVLILPMISFKTRLVLAFLSSLSIGILLLLNKVQRVTPWELLAHQKPNPRKASLESLLYIFISYGILIYIGSSQHQTVHFILGLLDIILVWLLVQIIYTIEYALSYYYCNGGLLFPDCSQPHWTEFLYQGFCIACCYQTSDTVVNTTPMRQLITTHALLSYIISVSVIAVLFGLLGSVI